MAVNVNGQADIIRLLEKTWSSFCGFVIAWFLEIIAICYFNDSLKLLSPKAIIALFIILLPVTYLFWTIATKRCFQRTGYWLFLHLTGIFLIGTGIYALVYPYLIKGSACDITYIQYWFTAVIVILLLIVFYVYISKKHSGLMIVFLVSNKSKYESDILQALKVARDTVYQETGNIKIVIPPFGIANTQEDSIHYINGWFNQADAVIFTSLIDSPGDSEFGYAFTSFTSRMSNRYIKKEKRDEQSVEQLMDEAYRCHEWNTLNSNKDQISRQIEVADNLTHLFLMYVSCIYLQKYKYTDAIEMAEKLFTFRTTGNVKYDSAIKDLMAYSYITAEQIEEQENKDYNRAHEILDDCIDKLPFLKHSAFYDLALARLYFYENNLRESKRYTKRVKDNYQGYEWHVAINLAFYALYEQKYKEVYTHYKKLLKLPKAYKNEVEFSIKFLMIELGNTTNLEYRMYLLHGLAFLNLYIDEKKSLSYLYQINRSAGSVGYSELSNVRELITSSRGKLRTRKE